jgi:hypothetical protein
MLSFLLKQVRRITAVADWLNERAATRAARRLRERFAPLVADAEKKKDWAERDSLLGEWSLESDFVFHPVYERRAERLTAKARKYGITVPRQPTRYSEESDDWELSNAYGFWLPSEQLERRLRREVRDEQRASYDEFRKWATLTFAIVGSMLALVSIRTKQKQPDPCSRNYYRSDSGACVFALQKTSPQPKKGASPIQASPVPPTPDKPSAARP